MTAMRLRGFSVPGPAKPSFLIPYFGLRTSNSFFVQELDDDNNVLAFLRYDPGHFEDYSGPIPETEVAIGASGILAFIDRDGQLNAGSGDNLRHILSEYQPAADGSDAFFTTEVMAFRGDQPGFEKAVESASRKFSNPDLGSRWQAREASRTGKGRSSPKGWEADFAYVVQRLRDLLGEHDWVRRFEADWRQFGPHQKLAEVAFAWLQEFGRVEQAGELFLILLPTRRRGGYEYDFGREIAYMAGQWLHGYTVAGAIWTRVWLRLHKLRFIAEDELRFLGLQYLKAQLPQPGAEPHLGISNSSVRVWKALWKDGGERNTLFRLLADNLVIIGVSEEFKILAALVDEPQYGEWACDSLEVWLDRASPISSNWAKACVLLLDRRSPSSKMVSIAVEWLSQKGQGYNAWYDLWRALGTHLRDEEHFALAHEWLHRGDIMMRIWPDVLGTLIDYGAAGGDKRIEALVAQWLLLGKETSRRPDIEQFVAGSVHGHPSLRERPFRPFLSYYHAQDEWRAIQVRNAILRDGPSYIASGLDRPNWEALVRAGRSTVERFLQNQLTQASMTVILFGEETAGREWINYEIVQSHQLGRPIIAIDIHALMNREGECGSRGRNPLSDWQIEIDGEPVSFTALYPTYDWVADDGQSHVLDWIKIAMRSREGECRLDRVSGRNGGRSARGPMRRR